MSVTICDVAPRDGLQNEAKTLEPADARRARQPPRGRRRAAHRGGQLRQPGARPADGGRRGGRRRRSSAREGVVYAGLVLNERGYDRLREHGPRRGALRLRRDARRSTSRNQNAVAEESLEAASAIVGRAHADGIRATVTIGVSFGCPFEGAVDPGRVLGFAERLADGGRGRDRLRRHDRRRRAAAGRASSSATASKLGVPIGVHLHNTRNTGFANAYAALEAGATVLDASVGGIGGCPFAPRATGNICTEDLVYMLHGEGIETGIDLDALIAVAEWLEGVARAAATRTGLPRRHVRAGRRLRKERANGVQARGRRGRHVHRPLPRRRRQRRRRRQYRVKTPSTPADPSEGVLTASGGSARRPASTVGDLRNILHGTTVATNAVLESKGARVGLITTQGFQQILHLARSQTPGPARGLDHHDQARPAGLARRHARGGRAHGRARRTRSCRSTSSRSRGSCATSSSRVSSR